MASLILLLAASIVPFVTHILLSHPRTPWLFAAICLLLSFVASYMGGDNKLAKISRTAILCILIGGIIFFCMYLWVINRAADAMPK